MTHLDKITIRGFKSIKTLEAFELANLNVLVGANGAGKSNFIELFRIISAMMRRGGLREYAAGVADVFFFGGPRKTSQIEVKLELGENGYGFELTPTVDGFLMLQNEMVCFNNRIMPQSVFMNGNYDSGLLEGTGSEDMKQLFAVIHGWQVYHFHDTTSLAGMRRYGDANHYGYLAGDARNLAAFLFRLGKQYPREYNHIKDVIRLVAPFFEDFLLQPNEKEYIRLEWRQKGLAEYSMRPTLLSDGTLRFICLATALLQPNIPSLVILDEPELGLHPDAIHILAELINLASKRTQVIVATQSPQLLDNFDLNDVIVVRRVRGETTFERLKEDDYRIWQNEFSVGELWTHDIIHGGTRYE